MDLLTIPDGSNWLADSLNTETDSEYDGATKGKGNGSADRQSKKE